MDIRPFDHLRACAIVIAVLGVLWLLAENWPTIVHNVRGLLGYI